MSWLRVDDGFTSHPKIAQLSDSDFRVWMRVLCHAARLRNPTVDKGTIQEVAGLSTRRCQRFVDLRLLDKTASAWEIHDWREYQPKDPTAADRMSRHRNKDRNADRNGTVTPDRNEDRNETVSPVPVPGPYPEALGSEVKRQLEAVPRGLANGPGSQSQEDEVPW